MVNDTNQAKSDKDQQVSSYQPISTGISKEHEVSNIADAQIEQVQEFQVPEELLNHIQVQKQNPDIPPDLKNIGVTHTPSDQPVSDVTSASASIPLTDDQLNKGLQNPPTSSIRWLSVWCLKQLKLAHVHLKKVKGRYIRVSDSS